MENPRYRSVKLTEEILCSCIQFSKKPRMHGETLDATEETMQIDEQYSSFESATIQNQRVGFEYDCQYKY